MPGWRKNFYIRPARAKLDNAKHISEKIHCLIPRKKYYCPFAFAQHKTARTPLRLFQLLFFLKLQLVFSYCSCVFSHYITDLYAPRVFLAHSIQSYFYIFSSPFWIKSFRKFSLFHNNAILLAISSGECGSKYKAASPQDSLKAGISETAQGTL